MKFLEIIYLMTALVLLGFLAIRFQELSGSQPYWIGGFGILAGLMFFFRRSQRLKMERIMREHADNTRKEDS